MATTFRLRRKLFAVSVGRQQLVEEISQGGGKTGYKKLYQTYNKQGEASKKAMDEALEKGKKWVSEQTAAGKKVTMADFAKGEGQSLFQGARDANKAHRQAADEIISKGNPAPKAPKGKPAPAAQSAEQLAASRSKQIAQQRYNSGFKGAGRWVKNTWNRGPGGKAGLIAGGAALVATPFIVGRATAKNKQQ